MPVHGAAVDHDCFGRDETLRQLDDLVGAGREVVDAHLADEVGAGRERVGQRRTDISGRLEVLRIDKFEPGPVREHRAHRHGACRRGTTVAHAAEDRVVLTPPRVRAAARWPTQAQGSRCSPVGCARHHVKSNIDRFSSRHRRRIRRAEFVGSAIQIK